MNDQIISALNEGRGRDREEGLHDPVYRMSSG